MKRDRSSTSRRATPWDQNTALTPTQEFIKSHHQKHYEQRHQPLSEADEADLFNSKTVSRCPFCQSERIKKGGVAQQGHQMYRCTACNRRFTVLTGTIFSGHKLSISEWIEYLYNLFSYVSLAAGSWNNKNAMTTSRYWLQKVFLVLEEYQKDVLLDGEVYLDETFYSVRSEDVTVVDGKKLRGLSRNQICIGVACTRSQVYCTLEGFGKPSQKKTYMAFKDHIKPGSRLVHDEDQSHNKLVNELGLASVTYNSGYMKALKDDENPMRRVNEIHFLMKRFFYAHSSFKREDIAGFINLFSFVMNPPSEKLEKVERFIDLGLACPRKLTYRDCFMQKKAKNKD